MIARCNSAIPLPTSFASISKSESGLFFPFSIFLNALRFESLMASRNASISSPRQRFLVSYSLLSA